MGKSDNESSKEPRRCNICGKYLSSYNQGKKCWHHETICDIFPCNIIQGINAKVDRFFELTQRKYNGPNQI